MFQMLGAYADAVLLIVLGVMGYRHVPRLVSQAGTPEQLSQRRRGARRSALMVLAAGALLLLLRIVTSVAR